MKFFQFFKKKAHKGVTESETNPVENNPDRFDTEEKITYNSDITIGDVVEYIKANPGKIGIQLNKPATDVEIGTFEKQKVKLPDDFKTLYKFSNGFETEYDLFRLIPLDEIIEREPDKSYLISNNSFHFTEYMIYSDMWSVDISDTNVNEYTIYNKADSFTYLTNSLAEFLCVFINKGIYEGLHTWQQGKNPEKP